MKAKAAILIKKIALEFEKMSNPVLQEMNLTAAQYKIVKYLLAHRQETVRQVDLEKYYSLTHPTTIGLLDKLEEKSYIVRQTNPADGRSRVIALTEKALSKEDELIEVGNRLEAKLTENLSEEEHAQLIFLLRKLLSGIAPD